MILDSNLGSSSSILFLTATGSGSILQGNSSSVIIGSSLNLASGDGSFNGLIINVPVINVNTGGTGSASLIDNASLTTLTQGFTGSYFALYTAGSLEVQSGIITGAGSNYKAYGGEIILANYSGIITVGKPNSNGGYINANNGSISITDYNTTSGKIDILSGSTLYASSSNAGIGNVTISIGQPSASNTYFSNSNLSLSSSGGGNIYFGNNGILADSPVNTLNAAGRNIIFDTGNLSASAITLGGNVKITADPPYLSQNLLNTNTNTAINSANVNNLINVNYLDNLTSGNTAVSSYIGGINNNTEFSRLPLTNKANNPTLNFSLTNSINNLKPIVFKTSNLKVNYPIQSNNNYTLVQPSRNLTCRLSDDLNLKIKKNTLVLIITQNKAISFYNLNDYANNALVLETANKSYDITASQHLSVALSNNVFNKINPLPNIGYRDLKVDNYHNFNIYTSNYSLVSLINDLRELKLNRELIKGMLKTEAIIQLTQGYNYKPFERFR